MPVFPDFDRFFSIGEWLNGRLSVRDNLFRIIDNSDETKKVAFQASGITTATTRTLTIPDADDTIVGIAATQTLTNKTLTSPVISTAALRRNVVDTGGAFATPIVLTAATSGSVYLLDDAAGLDFTLPTLAAASDLGINYTFVVQTEVTSNSYRITAGAAADLYLGQILMFDKDAATGDTNGLISLFRPDVSDDDAFTIAGADDTTGSLVGGWVEFIAISTTRWYVRGVLIGDGALATVFA